MSLIYKGFAKTIKLGFTTTGDAIKVCRGTQPRLTDLHMKIPLYFWWDNIIQESGTQGTEIKLKTGLFTLKRWEYVETSYFKTM